MKVIAIILIIMGLFLIISGIEYDFNRYLQTEIAINKRYAPTRQEIILECQRLEANKTNDNWSYSGCIKETLGETVNSL